MASEAGDLNQPRSSQHLRVLVRIADQPKSTGLELAGDLRGVQTLVPRVHLLLSRAGPGPSGSSGPSRRCRGCLPPSPTSLGSGCPQLPQAARQPTGCRSFTSTQTAAPHCARSRLSMRSQSHSRAVSQQDDHRPDQIHRLPQCKYEAARRARSTVFCALWLLSVVRPAGLLGSFGLA